MTQQDGSASFCIMVTRLQHLYTMQLQQSSCNIRIQTHWDRLRAQSSYSESCCSLSDTEHDSQNPSFSFDLTWGCSVTVGGKGARGLGCRPILLQRLLAPHPSLQLLHPALLLRLGSLRVQELLIRIVHAHVLCHQTPVNP